MALIAHVQASAASNPTTSPIDTTGATLLVVGVSRYGIGSTVTDTLGNTFTEIGTVQSIGTAYFHLYYVANPITGSDSFSIAGSGIYTTITVAAFSDTTSSPLDQTNQFTGSGSLTSIATGSVTPTQNGALVVAMWGTEAESTSVGSIGINNGMTITDAVGGVSGNYEGGGLAYVAQGTATAIDPTWSWTGAAPAVGKIASFFTAGGTSVSITGAAATGSAASLTPSLSLAPLGVAASSGIGTLVPSAGTAATAAMATGAVAGLVPSASTAPAAVAAIGAAGTLSPGPSSGGVAASASGAAAALAAAVAAGPSGVAATGQAASPIGGALPGVAAIAGTAALTPSVAAGAVAASATAAAGAVSAGSGTNVALTGVAAAGAVASLGIDLAAALAGIAALGAAGSVVQGGAYVDGVAASGIAAGLGIVSEITLSPAMAFAVAASVLGTLPPAAAYGIAAPVSGSVPALVADPVFIARGPSLRFTARGPTLRFTAIGRVGMRTNDLSPPIAANGETRTVTFDFGPQLAPGVTLTAIAAMNASVHWGYADPDPDERWQGAAQIIASPTTNASSQAVAQIFGDVPGATVYLLQCEASASDGTAPVLETTLTSYVPQ